MEQTIQLKRDLDVLVLGYYGFGNLGDELLAETVSFLLTKAGVKKESIAFLSASPEFTEERTGVRSYNRWSMSTICALMKRSKSFLLGGGGLFQDSTSIRSCGYYWWTLRTAHALGALPWAVGQSVGPLRSITAKYFTKNALSLCKYVSIRDKESAKYLQKWKIEYTNTPDLVMSNVIKHNVSGDNELLLNLRPGYPELSAHAAACARHIAEVDNVTVHGVALSEEDAVELAKVSDLGTVVLDKITVVKSIAEFENVMRNSTKAIGMRLHFLELCSMAGLQVCAVPYDPKVSAFCAEWGIPFLADNRDDVVFHAGDKTVFSSAADIVFDSFMKGYKAVVVKDGK